MARLHIVIMGAPGSGKGTQASRLARERGLAHLSTGDMLRDAVARRSELGVKAESYMKRGLLVPDEIIFGSKCVSNYTHLAYSVKGFLNFVFEF